MPLLHKDIQDKVNMEELRAEVYRLALLKLDEEDADTLTEAIMEAIEENLEEAVLSR